MAWASVTKSKSDDSKWEVWAASCWSGGYNSELAATLKAIDMLNDGVSRMEKCKDKLKNRVTELVNEL